MQKYKITSEYVGIENGFIIVDLKGLKDFYNWEIDEIIINNFNKEIEEDLVEIKKWELEKTKIAYMSDDELIEELKDLDYIVRKEDSDLEQFKKVLDYLKSFQDGENITITSDFIDNVEILEEIKNKIENKGE